MTLFSSDLIRSELFSIERLEQYAQTLAETHGVPRRTVRGRAILPRVRENARMLTRNYRHIVKTSQDQQTITPAAEWLIDNFHVVEEQIREVYEDLPPGFYRALPKLAAGPHEGYPRAFALAWAFIAHTDSRLDADWLRRFIHAYQRVQPLDIGEIWALAISLRIVLIENLRRAAEEMQSSNLARQKADTLADALLGVKGRPPIDPNEAMGSHKESVLNRAFAVQLVQRLRDQGERIDAALRWLNDQLAKSNTTPEELVRSEHQEQTAMNTSVRNIITSMRLVSSMDWETFFEDVSVVDAVLREGSGFAALDFATRDHYRHAIEALSRGSTRSERDIAQHALQATRRSGVSAERERDPGYYLIGGGREFLEKTIGFCPPLPERLLRFYKSYGTFGYLASLGLFTAIFGFLPIYAALHHGTEPWVIAIFAILALIPASDLAVAWVNRVVTESLPPQTLPKLDFSEGVPLESKTLVVMPILLDHHTTLEEHLQRLEIHYLSNPEGYLQFALLSDWPDAPMEQTPADNILLDAAQKGIRRLNDRYGSAHNSRRFLLLHRRRLWNESEGHWMGWERKRGKLEELNRLLRHQGSTTFLENPFSEDEAPVRYVLTLDADTCLPRGAIYRLTGTLAHPLNRPEIDPKLQRVTRGYGILQPRITATLPARGRGSRYQQIYSGAAGVDPYAFAVSDVYQDLFDEGSFTGKGLYDVEAFSTVLAGRIPENTLLSHDLFEGLYARAGLATDIELYEEFPSQYEVACSRAHRWVRGDWQLLPWIFKPTSGLRFISRWKMTDNLRRSLSAPSAFLALLFTWAAPGTPLSAWSLFMVASWALPSILPVFFELWPRRRHVPIQTHLKSVLSDLALALWQVSLSVSFLAHQAWSMGDAIVRTLYRLFISRRHLLEWTSAAQAKILFSHHKRSIYSRMACAPLLAAGSTGLVLTFAPERFWPAVPFLWLWFLSPTIAQHISREDPSKRRRVLSEAERNEFRRIARKTWRFFEKFVTPEHHDLPPDNFQEIPEPIVAHRTSPTNIGVYLLSVLAARDFGWIGLLETLERLEVTLRTVQALPRYEGHLFNWYDTHDLRPLEPHYVSTVDSGNLAGHLWTLAEGCRQLRDDFLIQPAGLQGLLDVLAILENRLTDLKDVPRTEMVSIRQFVDAVTAFKIDAQDRPQTLTQWNALFTRFLSHAETILDMARTLAHDSPHASTQEILEWAEQLRRQMESLNRDRALLPDTMVDVPRVKDIPDLAESPLAASLLQRLSALIKTSETLVQEMRFAFLFDPTKKLFSIGYQVAERRLDPSHYDLLASEARLASFVAIAKNDVPAEHWFHMARFVSPVEEGLALLSWSGSMFEYLMPSLVMQAPETSLLEQTVHRVVRRQIAYGRERKVPWGISEAAYNVQNLEFTYQYSNFGVPGLGLKRGLSNDLVIAPYATGLAAMVDPVAAALNFRHLAAEGAEGPYGFYEALDYTPERLPEDQRVAIIHAYMAHHQGMMLVALNQTLCDGAMSKRFHAQPRVLASELLLQERTPRDVPVSRIRAEVARGESRTLAPLILRRFQTPHDVMPRTHLLSNGRYSVMLTAAGSGYSRWKSLAVTRWREDTTRDYWGTYFFIRDIRSGEVWSAGYQPRGVEPDSYEVDFSEDRAEIVRRDGTMTTTLEVVVSPEDDAEIRRITLRNGGSLPRELDITSYAEIVMATPAADQAHMSFSNLFVQTEFVAGINALLAGRRPRSSEEASVWAAHIVVVEGNATSDIQYESNRARFLGHGRGIRTPMCVIDGKPLSNTSGSVLDPIMSLRGRVRIEPGETARLTFTTLAADSREQALSLADKYHDAAMFERVQTLAWTHAHVQQHHLGIAPDEAHLYQELAGRLLYNQPALRPSSEVLKRNLRGAPGLWTYGISGDLPILLARIEDLDDNNLVRELLRAHEYWRMKNFAVDLVILNDKTHSYVQDLQTTLDTLVQTYRTTHLHNAANPQGQVFILKTSQLSLEDRTLLLSAARAVIISREGSLAQQMERLERPAPAMTPLPALATGKPLPPVAKSLDTTALRFFNGLGGFSSDGREYVIVLGTGQWTPAPWINVIANADFGFHVSETGAGSTWSMNSRENQLTPWSNDPVSDAPGEIFYIRDEDSGELWTPTALPIREEAWPYLARHGQGYSQFQHTSHGIEQELLQFVPLHDSVKISRLTLTNHSGRTRRLSVTAYIEWVLGNSRSQSAPFIVSERDPSTGAILARNVWNTEFAERVAFAHLSGSSTHWTADRTEFLGRNGTLDHPAALERGHKLSGTGGAGLDPCAALQNAFELKAGARLEIVFLLGQGANRQAALELVTHYSRTKPEKALAPVEKFWGDMLEAIQVKTPDPAMDLMLNRWLLYQTLVCRLWARAAFYQAGGAYGFRDQLQDVMALMVARRDLARHHILRAAARQFPEGDVQHWWHPPTGRGVRTRMSDDLVWLAYVVIHYLEVTSDTSILDENIPFLESRPIPDDREDLYFQPAVSSESATLFEHCARALDRSLKVGEHGLPLMGTGDWNDGMNRVGHEGKGESVWLAWFLHTTLWEFAKVADTRGEAARAEKWRLHVGELRSAAERHGWDGEWYRRAYFDDGSPLGSATNTECRIDSIAQSWGILCGAADPARGGRAMAAVDEHLVRREDKLVLLFTPPFQNSKPNPGYIQGYPAGVRENGGQYTHAAVWNILAYAALGNGDKAMELFSMINPITHGSTRTDIQRYKVEPYVLAGDVYSVAPHVGRGGWTWYTGSAGWMYRAGIEWILGFRLRGTKLFMDPCIPKTWKGFTVTFRYHSAQYEVSVENPNGVCKGVHSAEMDGKPVRGGVAILLVDDGTTHHLRITLG